VTLLARSHSAAFGKEREEAVALGAKFRWPCYTQEITREGVKLTTGEVISADTVVVAIGGDKPDLAFLPPDVLIERGFIHVNENYQTTDPQIFAVGDAVKPGLLTDAIGAGRKAAQVITDLLQGKRPHMETRQMIDRKRIALEYFDPRVTDFDDVDHCASQCSSCGVCRDCGICVAICPQAAISRQEKEEGVFEYVVDEKKCIGCGFCAAACPCGIWDLVENEPLV
jgi:ferredoxin